MLVLGDITFFVHGGDIIAFGLKICLLERIFSISRLFGSPLQFRLGMTYDSLDD